MLSGKRNHLGSSARFWRCVLLCSVLAWPVGAVGAQESNADGVLAPEDFSVECSENEFVLFDSIETIKHRLGEPTGTEIARIVNEQETHPSDVFWYHYEGISFMHYRRSKEIVQIRIDSPNCVTLRGIRVGDSLSQVLEAYPPSQNISLRIHGSMVYEMLVENGERVANQIRLWREGRYDPFTQDFWGLQFHLSGDDTVTRISIARLVES